MSDIFLFIKQGWQNLWKINIIWLFSALSIASDITNFIPRYQNDNLSVQFIYLIVRGGLLILTFISWVGVPYLAFCLSINKSITIQQTLQAVKKFSRRIIGYNILIGLISSPFLCWTIYISIDNSNATPILDPDKLILIFFPSSILSALWSFIELGFFSHDLNIKQSISKAWDLFTSHFLILALLGITILVIQTLFSDLLGIITLLIQSSFDLNSINELSFISPHVSLNKNLLFLFLNRIFLIIFVPYTAFVFTSAYLKYNKMKI